MKTHSSGQRNSLAWSQWCHNLSPTSNCKLTYLKFLWFLIQPNPQSKIVTGLLDNNEFLKDLGSFYSTGHNVNRFTLDLHSLKIMIVERFP